MSIAPTSAEGSAAAWAAEAAGAAEAYVEAQANEAARQRDLEEKRQAQLAASGQGRTDGVDPPPPPLPAHQSFWANDPNRPGGTAPANGNGGSGSTASAGSGGSGGGLLIPDGNGGYVYIPPDTASVTVTVTPDLQAPDFILPIGHSGNNSSPVAPPPNPPPSPPPADPHAAPNAANEVTKPEDPEKPKQPPKIVSGLGEDVDKILNNSETLQKQWAKLQAEGWKLEATDGKSRTDYGKQRIYINPAEANTTGRAVQLFSHEVGHAVSGPENRVTADGRTKSDYVARNVEGRLTAEGAAAFENCKHREEIEAGSDIDIGIAGRNSDGPYLEIYEDFKSGKISEETAKYRMGQLMGEEWEYRDGTTKREAYEADEANRYQQERASGSQNAN